jgi:hypothetical protein
MTSQQFEPSFPPFSLHQDEGSQLSSFPQFPSFDGYTLNPKGSNANPCLADLHHNYETLPDDFYGLSDSSATPTSSVLGPDPSAYPAMVPTSSFGDPFDPLIWDF